MADDIGAAERRTEDARFLTGCGRYLDDLALPRQAWGYVVRSPHAHAGIGAIDVGAAAAMPGVCAVYTAADLGAAGMGAIPCVMAPKGKDGTAAAVPPRPVLAAGRVRMVGDPVAFAVAESAAEARAAAEAVAVAYRPLAAVTDAEAALAPGAPALHAEAPGNLCVDWELGDRKAAKHALGRAAHVVSMETRNQRLIGAPMEARGALGDYDAGQRHLHPHRRHPGRPFGAGCPGQAGVEGAGPAAARGDTRCRRRLRGQALGLSRVCAGALRCPRVGAPGQVGGGAGRVDGVRPSGPRSPVACHPRARRRRALPRAQPGKRRQSRRLSLQLRALHSHGRWHPRADRPLPDSGRARSRPHRLHQHGADGCLSRRRQAGERLSAGAPDRQGGAYAWPRSRRVAPPQPRPGRRHALPNAARTNV